MIVIIVTHTRIAIRLFQDYGYCYPYFQDFLLLLQQWLSLSWLYWRLLLQLLLFPFDILINNIPHPLLCSNGVACVLARYYLRMTTTLYTTLIIIVIVVMIIIISITLDTDIINFGLM